jgi:hypothetical protein
MYVVFSLKKRKNSQKDYQAYRNYHFKIICMCVAYNVLSDCYHGYLFVCGIR